MVNIQIIQIVSVKTKLIDPLVEECTENVDETELVKKTLDKNNNKCTSYVAYKVLFWILFIFFIISIKIGIYFAYYKYKNNKHNFPY